MSQPIRTIIVDDSAPIRQMFSKFLSGDPAIEVAATAEDPHDARDKIKQLNPDVITLDIEMPHMDGISFLEKIMSLRPMPVLMVSTLTQRGADTSLRAMEIGAFDYIAKPQRLDELETIRHELISKVKAAAKAKIQTRVTMPRVSKVLPYHGPSSDYLIAIGASTGGVEALRDVLSVMPASAPPIVITQHMPPLFTASFSKRLDGICQIRVCEAEHGMRLRPGMVYIAPGGLHMRMVSRAGALFCHLEDGPLVAGHKPSVDVLMESVAAEVGPRAVAALLTGMGKDGARGLLAIRERGGITLGQNEASCVVYGMPKAAFELGAVQHQLALADIPKALLKHCE